MDLPCLEVVSLTPRMMLVFECVYYLWGYRVLLLAGPFTDRLNFGTASVIIGYRRLQLHQSSSSTLQEEVVFNDLYKLE